MLYTTEAAERAVTFALDIFATCVASPNPKHQAVAEWAQDLRPTVGALVERGEKG